MKIRTAFLLILLASLLAALLGLIRVSSAHAATTSTGSLSGSTVTVNNGSGDQTDPHVSGDWVSYTDNSTGNYEVRYHNLFTGEDDVIPTNGGQDLLSGISGNLIVFDHFDTTASTPNWDVYIYSLATQTLYRVTNTLTNETLSDISVTSDGTARVVWNTLESDYNVYGFIFQAPVTLTATVTNVSAVEGSPFSGTVATGTYSGAGTLSASINWGDGSSSPGSVSLNTDGSYSVTGSHTYAEEGSFDLTVQVSASGGQSAAATGKAAVADAPLTITRLLVGVTGKGLAGLAATFTDAGPAGTVSDYLATISWGDGATSTGLIAKNPTGAGFVVAGAHQYAKAGTYTVTLMIRDGGGSSVTRSQTLVVS